MQERFVIVTGKVPSGTKLIKYLLDQYAGLSKLYLRDQIKAGFCEVNGRIENSGFLLRQNDLIEIEIDLTRQAAMRAEEFPLEVLFEDASLIVVNKPHGMLMHPSHREKSGTLLNALTFHFNRDKFEGPSVRPGLVHRLDKDTSGLTVAAKDPKAHRRLSGAFERKLVEKRYVAVVKGVVEKDLGMIDLPIARFADGKHWTVMEDGKPSVSNFWVIDRRDETTLIELEPVTGRTNQLRIHCEAIGHPIIGDVRRGGGGSDRLYLHARKLSFPHPVNGEMLTFETSLPTGF